MPLCNICCSLHNQKHSLSLLSFFKGMWSILKAMTPFKFLNIMDDVIINNFLQHWWYDNWAVIIKMLIKPYRVGSYNQLKLRPLWSFSSIIQLAEIWCTGGNWVSLVFDIVSRNCNGNLSYFEVFQLCLRYRIQVQISPNRKCQHCKFWSFS